MKKIHLGHLFVGLCVLVLGIDIGLSVRDALASRNSAGTMSTINTFVSGTTISSTNVNANFADVSTELTDSLSRSGKGAMLAPLRLTNGTFAAPSLTFDSDTDVGIYRIGANNLGVTAAGAKVLDVATTGLGVTGTLSTTGVVGIGSAASYPVDVSIVTGSTAARFSSTGPFMINDPSVAFNLDRNSGLKYATTNPGLLMSYDVNTGNLTFNTAPSGTADAAATTTERMRVNTSGVTIGSGGTAISGSFRGTSSVTPGAISANVCTTIASPTVTGAASGADCLPIIPAGLAAAGAVPGCSANLNGCDMWLCNVKVVSYTPPAGTYGCRVFNP